MRGSIVCAVLVCAASPVHGEAELRPITRHISTIAPRTEIAAKRPTHVIDPATVAAVFAPVLIDPDADSVIEHDGAPDHWRVTRPAEKKPWRPRVMPHPMSFPTGGSGVKLKIRFDSKW